VITGVDVGDAHGEVGAVAKLVFRKLQLQAGHFSLYNIGGSEGILRARNGKRRAVQAKSALSDERY
jgi:hypothetical protein